MAAAIATTEKIQFMETTSMMFVPFNQGNNLPPKQQLVMRFVVDSKEEAEMISEFVLRFRDNLARMKQEKENNAVMQPCERTERPVGDHLMLKAPQKADKACQLCHSQLLLAIGDMDFCAFCHIQV